MQSWCAVYWVGELAYSLALVHRLALGDARVHGLIRGTNAICMVYRNDRGSSDGADKSDGAGFGGDDAAANS